MSALHNRIGTTKNPYQGKYKKVLCVCSAGCLRSPTAAEVLSREPFNFNTRAAGVYTDFAIVAVDPVLLHWADEIVCMDEGHKRMLEDMMDKCAITRPIVVLNIGDVYEFRDPELVKAIKAKYVEATS